MQSSKFVTVRLLSDNPKTPGDPSDPVSVAFIKKSDAEWKKLLGTDGWRILRAKGTEAPFCGALLDEKERGVYFCGGCGLPVFHSDTKFHSGTGWPSFYQPFAKENLVEIVDRSHGMTRTEILCTRCGGHLGHVFPDGPPPTHLRYCINSGSLTFRSLADIEADSKK